MTYNTITIRLGGRHEALKNALVFACHFYSESKISGNVATLTYHSEAQDYDQAIAETTEAINLDQLERLGVEFLSMR